MIMLSIAHGDHIGKWTGLEYKRNMGDNRTCSDSVVSVAQLRNRDRGTRELAVTPGDRVS